MMTLFIGSKRERWYPIGIRVTCFISCKNDESCPFPEVSGFLDPWVFGFHSPSSLQSR
ncbi:hypothetical protein COLO4_32146 [Corchorus olitorius]|uniref:Uncharacterized protein n=1 Tax=Corchorus olitorius TaxID=93759 RepID=A0A1R3H0Y7_9ROSI|nr:hypothetical protein COLO4_32146 [Corchorus olitorius]